MTTRGLKQQKTGNWVVRDPQSGRLVEVRGANAMKAAQLSLRDRVDLTKPIAEQVLEPSLAQEAKSTKETKGKR